MKPVFLDTNLTAGNNISLYPCKGGLDNTINQIIDPMSNNVLVDNRDVVLSCSQAKWFWISWLNGILTVGKYIYHVALLLS